METTTLEKIKQTLTNIATKDDVDRISGVISKMDASLTKRLDLLESKLYDLENQNDNLHTELKRLKEENSSLRQQLDRSHRETVSLRAAINDKEQHGRGWNVRVHGVPEQKEGTDSAKSCGAKCVEIFSQKIGVDVTEKDIEAAHRSGKLRGTRP
ncbi:hypothetical protein ACOMHN_062876 [Nucella lapillus]